MNGNTIKVFKTSMDGLGNYDRNKGYTDGEVADSWETLTRDRGRAFMVDRMAVFKIFCKRSNCDAQMIPGA